MEISAKISWVKFKEVINQSSLQIKYIELSDRYLVFGIDDPIVVQCSIQKETPASYDQTDFETNYKPSLITPIMRNVVTSHERDDKMLRTLCGFADTDVNGVAEICIPVPQPGRWIAYGDCEFDVRHFGDRVTTMEVADLDRLVAWQIALAIDPGATEPVADAVVQASGYPDYPILGYYDERSLPDPLPANAKGTLYPGMAMTFQYGITEAQPVAGYAFIPGGMYFRLKAKKASPNTTGFKCYVSIDWAEPKA